MSYNFNARDLDILNILCSSSTPLTASDIVDSQRDLTQSTVISILRKLLTNNLIEVAGIAKAGRVDSRTYRPTPLVRENIVAYYQALFQKTKCIISVDDIYEECK